MNESHVKKIISDCLDGQLSLDEASSQVLGVLKLGDAQVDLDRKDRCGFQEVIYGKSKTIPQVVEILGAMAQRGLDNILVTKASAQMGQVLVEKFSGSYDPASQLYHYGSYPPVVDQATLLCAGTSDLPIAQECFLTLKALGISCNFIKDVGVAGIHRLLNYQDDLARSKVVIVIAGMEGALLSVVGGLVKCPLIGVPTSVGYGASFQGLAALLSMLNSCAAGSAVVNIDNGFGAAVLASRILQVH